MEYPYGDMTNVDYNDGNCAYWEKCPSSGSNVRASLSLSLSLLFNSLFLYIFLLQHLEPHWLLASWVELCIIGFTAFVITCVAIGVLVCLLGCFKEGREYLASVVEPIGFLSTTPPPPAQREMTTTTSTSPAQREPPPAYPQQEDRRGELHYMCTSL